MRAPGLLERRAAEASEVLQVVGWADGQREAHHTRGGTHGDFFGCTYTLEKTRNDRCERWAATRHARMRGEEGAAGHSRDYPMVGLLQFKQIN